MNGRIDLMRTFLDKLDVIRKKYEDIESQKDQFNIFSTMFDPSDEVNLHSTFIYSLLKFRTNEKAYYLDTFLKAIESKFEYSLASLEIWQEYKDIDILLVDRLKKKAVIIENKIYAHDSNHQNEGQLEKYYRIVVEEEKIPEDGVEVYYLSLNNREPSSESISTSKKYPLLKEIVQCISYPIQIKSWLQECMKFVYDKPFQRETILQYIKLINDMVNDVDIEERIEIKKLIGESKSNLESAKLLIDNICHLHWHTIADFWNGLASALDSHGYEVTRKPTEEDYTDIAHGSSKKKNKAELLICINTKLPFIIQIEETKEDWFCYGVKKGKRLAKEYLQVLKEFIENDDNYEEAENWYICKTPSLVENEDCFNSWDIQNDITFRLISDDFRQRLTSIIVDDIDKFVDEVGRKLR